MGKTVREINSFLIAHDLRDEYIELPRLLSRGTKINKMTKMQQQHIEYLRHMIETSERWADVAREELRQLREELAEKWVFFV